MENNCKTRGASLECLPCELVLEIATFLDDRDCVSLANVNRRFLQLLAASNRRSLNMALCYTHSTIQPVQTFLEAASDFLCARKIDFSHCYWFNSTSLVKLLSLASPTLTSLSVCGTNMKSNDLALVLRRCPNIIDLSLTFDGNDSSFWKVPLAEDEDDAQFLLVNSIFFGMQKGIGKLRRLALYGDSSSFIIFRVFLGFCSGLETLHMEINQGRQMSFRESLKTGHIFGNLRRLLPPCEELHQLTCKIYNQYETADLFSHLLNSLVARKQGQFHVLWAPNVSVNQYITCLHPRMTALQTSGGAADAILDYQEISCLRTQMQHFLQNFSIKLDHLQLVSCCYDPEYFVAFANYHANLKVLQLLPCFPNYLYEPGPELAVGLSQFPKLVAFSVTPRFFPTAGDENSSPLNVLNKHSPLLQELEIGVPSISALGSRDFAMPVYEARSKCVSIVGKFLHLTKLTLANLEVDSFNFLQSILDGCKKLKSLRLTNIIQCGRNDYKYEDSMSFQLKIFFRQAKCLEDFRLELGRISDDHNYDLSLLNRTIGIDCIKFVVDLELLIAFRFCRTLQRLVILGNRNIFIQLENIIFDWPTLILACIITPKIDWDACRFKIVSSHAASQSYFGPSLIDAASKIASVHYNDMILFDSHVAKMPL